MYIISISKSLTCSCCRTCYT